MQNAAFRVHADAVLPVLRAHLARVAEAQWVLLANGTADSATQVLLADMCARATHKLCVNAAALLAAERTRGRAAAATTTPPTTALSVVGGLASALAAALDVASKPSVSARKLDVVLQEEVRARVKATLAARAAPPLYVPTTFTDTEVLAKMVVLTGGVLKVHLSMRDGPKEVPQSGEACALELKETTEAVGHILRKWSHPKQDVEKTAAEIVGIIVKDLRCHGSADGGCDSASAPNFDLALIKDPLTKFFRCRPDPDRGAGSLRQRTFLNFCRRKFEELTSELEQVRYQGTLVCRDQDPLTALESPLTFRSARSRLEDIFERVAAAADDGSDVDRLRSEADAFSVELVDKMYRYVISKRIPVPSPEVRRRLSEPLVLETDQKKTDNLQVLTMILEDSAKRFVEQLALWLKLEPGTRRNHADELCGCLNDIRLLVAMGAAPPSTAVCPQDTLAFESPAPDTVGDSRPLQKVSPGTGMLEKNTEVHLQEDKDGPGPENAFSDDIGDSRPLEKGSSGTNKPENKPEVHSQEHLDTCGPENGLPDAVGDSCASEGVSAGTGGLENKPGLCRQEDTDAHERINLAPDGLGDSAPLEENSTGTTSPENEPEVLLREGLDIPGPKNPIRVVNGDSCALGNATGHPENKPEICLRETAANLGSKNSSPETTADRCSLEKVSTGTRSPENQTQVCWPENTDPPGSENMAVGTKGDSDRLEKLSAPSPESEPEVNLQQDRNAPPRSKSPTSNSVCDPTPLENFKCPENKAELCFQEATEEPGSKSPPPDGESDSHPSVRATSAENKAEFRLREDATAPRSERLATNATGDSNPLEKVSAGTTIPESTPEMVFPEHAVTAVSEGPSPDTGGDSGTEAIVPGTSPETKRDLEIHEPESASPLGPSSVCSSTTARSPEPKADSHPLLPEDTSPETKSRSRTPRRGDPDDPGPKTPPLRTGGVYCPSPPHLLCLQEAENTSGSESPDYFGDIEGTSADTIDNSQPAPAPAAARPRTPAPEVSASPFRPLCSVQEELLTLVDVVMVQLFAGLPKNVGRLVLSQDTVAAVHRVSKRMTEDALLLPWTKLGPCKLNRMVKEVVRDLKRECGSSQRLADVFLFDPDTFDDLVLKLLTSRLDGRPDDARPGASAAGAFWRAFCVRSNNTGE